MQPPRGNAAYMDLFFRKETKRFFLFESRANWDFAVSGDFCCGMTHWCMWHDPLICVTWVIHIWNTFPVNKGSKRLASRLIQMYAMTDWYVWHNIWYLRMTHWHDSFKYGISAQSMREQQGSCAEHSRGECRVSSICMPWLIDMYAMTHWYLCHDSLICAHDLLICVTWLFDIGDKTHWDVPIPRWYVCHD